MASILDEIVAHKLNEISAGKSLRSESQLRSACERMPPVRDFTSALRQPGLRIIAEVKKASPSAGVIRADFDPISIARAYQDHGADCISVLTDRRFFQGELQYLSDVHASIRLPVLRKEFILDSWQILEARAAGADAVLLIAEILPGNRLRELHEFAVELGLHVLVELHDAEELPRVIDCGAVLIGINNRNLRTFTTSLAHTLDLLPKIPSGRLAISESGIRTHADWKLLESAGAKAILVGESLMRSPDIGLALDQLRGWC